MRGSTLTAAHADLADCGLVPLFDDAVGEVRADCPACRAGAQDPLGLYRPLTVDLSPRNARAVRLHCQAGCLDQAVLRALDAGPVDWQRIAEDCYLVATAAVALLEGTLIPAPMAVAA